MTGGNFSKNNLATPNLIPWPPLVFGCALLLSLAFDYWIPAKLADLSLLGWIVSGLGLYLDVWAILTMRQAQTNIFPHRPADKLVTWGPFKLTRNPIYIGNTSILFGLGIALNSLWFLSASFISAAILRRLAILPEERHLSEKFGQEWKHYASKTPRWLTLGLF